MIATAASASESIKNKCGFCSRTFTRKIYYDKHVLTCELFSKTKRERSLEVEECEDTPTVRKLYEIIMEMSVKYKKLEEKVEELSKYVDTKKKKINVVDWLNNTYKSCETPFDEWFKKIKVERRHLENIFNNDYVYGALEIIKEHIQNCGSEEHTPIRAYEHRDNVFFIFMKSVDANADANDNSWCEMTQQQFNAMIVFIAKQFLHEFVVWQNENKHRVDDDSYTMIYTTNIKKINGGNNTTEQLYRKIHRELYKHLHTSIGDIIQYDII